MRQIPSRHRYFEWDGSQALRFDLDEVLQQLADDVAEYGDLGDALRRLMSRGIRPPMGGQRRGLNQMLRSLRERQNEQLRRFDLSSVMRDIESQLEEIVDMERRAVANMRDNLTDDENDFTQDALRAIAGKREEELNQLPPDTPGRMDALQKYDFLDPKAQRKFQELLKKLRDSISDSFFKNLSDRINNMSPEDLQRMKDMMKALNDMLVKKIAGEEDTGFDEFMKEFGDMFGDQPPESLDELLQQMQQQMAAAQSLLWSLSKSQRDQLGQLLNDRFDDPELNAEINKLRKELDYLMPPGKSFGFRGEEELDLEAARRLMEQMHEFEQLKEQILGAERSGDLDKIDRDLIKEILGDEAAEELVDLQRIREMLKDAGLIRQVNGKDWELTPVGARKLGFKALAEIYARLREARLGSHAVPEEGRFGDRQADTKEYEFGDPLHLDLPKTIYNAIVRNGPGTPVDLNADDFEIHRSELKTATHTVMCLDLSTSMAMRGAFQPAKKVALALQHLITSQYPHDSFYVIGFDVLAREVKPHELLYLQWDEYMTGTNMEHALLLSEKLLAEHKGGTKQVILISDGEPTVHFVNGRTQFNYPPTRATLRATYRAVQRCTKRNISINTFMLDADGYFANFIDEVTKINGGRVFYTNPRRLGEYVLVDYINGKRSKIH